MKIMRLLSYLLVAVLCVGFTSCSDDDEDDKTGNNSKKFVISRYSTSGYETYKTKATYNTSNQLIKIVVDEENQDQEVYSFDYEKGIMTEKRGDRDACIVNFKLNKQSYLSNVNYVTEYGETSIEYTYDNGYLTQIKMVEDRENYTRNTIAQLSYTGNNLVSSTITSDGITEIVNYKYSNDINKNGIMAPLSTPYYGICDDECDILYQSGLMGKQNQNLLTSYSLTEKDNGSTYNSSCSYSYQFDNDGNITACIEKEDGFEEEIWLYTYK